jgi:hypothetical protein
MKKIAKFSLLIALTSLLACGGASEQKTSESKTDSTANKPTKEKSEGEKAENNESSKDESFARSLVGRWDYESGETAGELDGLWHYYTTDGKFESGGGMFGVEGTYTVKDGQLIIKSKQTVPDVEAGKEFNVTYTIVEVTNKAPYRLTLKNSKGNTLNYMGQSPAPAN